MCDRDRSVRLTSLGPPALDRDRRDAALSKQQSKGMVDIIRMSAVALAITSAVPTNVAGSLPIESDSGERFRRLAYICDAIEGELGDLVLRLSAPPACVAGAPVAASSCNVLHGCLHLSWRVPPSVDRRGIAGAATACFLVRLNV